MLRDEKRSPALKSYAPGEGFEYMAVVYNANKKEKTPDLESQIVLYGNGNERMRGEPEKIDLSCIGDLSRIPIRRKMLLGEALPEGDYVLQLLVKDRKANKSAAQALSFQVASQ